MSRTCRDCGMCCTLYQVDSLGKPAGVRCSHLKGTRCSIYNDRPEDCRAYECGWLQGGPVPKPVKAGIIADPSKSPLADLMIHLDDRVRSPGKRFLKMCEEKEIKLLVVQRGGGWLSGPAGKVIEALDKLESKGGVRSLFEERSA